MQTTATRQPPASKSSFRLCSIAPNKRARKKPLSKKNRTMLTELFTPVSVPEAASPRSSGTARFAGGR